MTQLYHNCVEPFSSYINDTAEMVSRSLNDEPVEATPKGSENWESITPFLSEGEYHPNFEKFDYRKPDNKRYCPLCTEKDTLLDCLSDYETDSKFIGFFCPTCSTAFTRNELDTWFDKHGWKPSYTRDGNLIMPNGEIMRTDIYDDEKFPSVKSKDAVNKKFEQSKKEQRDEQIKNDNLIAKTLMDNLEEYFANLKLIEKIYDNAVSEIKDGLADDGSLHELTEYSIKQYALKAVYDEGKRSAKSIGQILRETCYPKLGDVLGTWDDLTEFDKAQYNQEAIQIFKDHWIETEPTIRTKTFEQMNYMKEHIDRECKKIHTSQQ